MRHRAHPAVRPGRHRARVDGVVRISGAYPPPVRPAWEPPPPHVTRYQRPSWAPRVWTATSAVLTAVGVSVLVVAPHPSSARLDVPVAVAADPRQATATPRRLALALPVLPPSQPVRVRIPALGTTSAVMPLDLTPDGSMEVPPAGYPVGWYDRSPSPGETGPAVLAGHVDWGGKPGAFYGLRDLLPGDQVVVERSDGVTVVFAVDRVEEHAKDDFPTAEVYGDLGVPGLRLITCGGSFDEDTGDYADNVVVFASLVGTHPTG